MAEVQYEVDQKRHLKQAGIGVVVGVIKGLIASIPVIGSSITAAWEGYQGSRLQEAIDYLTAAVTKLGEDKIDKQFIESEEYVDLFNLALRTRMQSRCKEKAKFILGMLIESMQKNRAERFQTSEKESFLFILDRLTEKEMAFLYRFSQSEYRGKSKNDIYQNGDDLALAVDGLLTKGLLREDDTWEKHLVESMLGREFIAYLKILSAMETG